MPIRAITKNINFGFNRKRDKSINSCYLISKLYENEMGTSKLYAGVLKDKVTDRIII